MQSESSTQDWTVIIDGEDWKFKSLDAAEAYADRNVTSKQLVKNIDSQSRRISCCRQLIALMPV